MVDVANFTLDSLAQQFSAATATEADSLVASARPIALFAEFAFDTGLTFIGLGILLSGILIIRSRAVHHLLRVPAVLGGFLIPLHWLWFLNENLVWIARAGLILTLLYFLLMGIWLIVRGTREAPAT